MEIPEEASDAAFEAYYANTYMGGPTACSAAMRAAAPYLMAQALEDAAASLETRSETFLATMRNMTGLPEYGHDDIVRYGAYSAEANSTAARLRRQARAYRESGDARAS